MERYIEARTAIILLVLVLATVLLWFGRIDGAQWTGLAGAGMAFPLGEGVINWLCSRAKAE